MADGRLIFRVHAIQRMFERKISEEEIHQALIEGETIERYPDDQPFPSRLVLCDVQKRALHIVVADNKSAGETIVVSVYEPDDAKWEKDFKRRKKMTCVICKHGETQLGKATVTLERDGMTLVFKAVPADICTNCGEQYIAGAITSRLLKTANDVAGTGVEADIRVYKAA